MWEYTILVQRQFKIKLKKCHIYYRQNLYVQLVYKSV